MVWVNGPIMFLLEVVELGGSARAPPEHTEGGAVGSKDFSPDSVGWGTSGGATGHRPLEKRQREKTVRARSDGPELPRTYEGVAMEW
jgi:hypothetical protein